MKYKTVVIDPPWPISQIGGVAKSLSSEGTDRKPHARRNRFKTQPYSSMSLEDILQYPINDYADDESLLFLWVTNSKSKKEKKPIIQFGFELLESWGFTYHQLITIDKVNAYAFWSPIATRTEHCIVAYRGNFNNLTQKQNYKMENLIVMDYQNKHSQKPVKFYQLLREWTPEPRIDLFARQAHYGFDGWGNEYVGEGPLMEFLE